MDKYEQILKESGATNIEYYVLISNYGYTFDLKGKHYDIRYWANCYGVARNIWEISCLKEDRTLDIQNIENLFNKS